MQKFDVVLRESAIEDLVQLSLYIIEASGFAGRATAYANSIEPRCQQLSMFPFVGRSRDDIRPGIRILVFSSAIIAYEVSGDQVIVRRIFGQAQDYAAILRDEGG